MEEKVLLEWKALDRPNKKWSKDFYSTVIVLAFLVSVILFFIEGLMPVLVVWAVVFMMWSINRMPSQEVNYAITESGIRSGNSLTRWVEMNNYWFEEKWGSQLLRVAIFRLPWQLVYVIERGDEEKIRKILDDYVAYEVPKETWMDRMIKWFEKKIPLD